MSTYTIPKLAPEPRRTIQDITSRLGMLTTAIAEQNLEKYGYSIGDYFTGASTYRYTLADMDTFYGDYNAYAVVNTHHVGVVVDTNTNVKWNDTNDTSTGYAGSNLRYYLTNTALPLVRSDITALFGDSTQHLIGHKLLWTTATSSWGWTSDAQYISALTSVQLHGSPICDIDFYSTGEGNKPLQVFQKFFYPQILGNQSTWLRSINSASIACVAGSNGGAGSLDASYSFGAAGLILLH